MTSALIVVRDVTDARHDAQELRTALDALERRTRELTVLRELGDLLATSRTLEEFGEVIGGLAPQLFPSESGATYLLAPPRNVLDLTDPPLPMHGWPGGSWMGWHLWVEMVPATSL